MPTPMLWSLRSFAALVVLAAASGSAFAQFGQPGGLRPAPQVNPRPQGQPNPNARNPLVMPSINTWPGLPANQMFPPVIDLPTWMNPAINNPWMNQTNFIPVRRNPFAMNPFWNNPFLLNPLLRNPGNNFLNNPFAVPGYDSRFTPEFGPVTQAVAFSPPLAVQQPGMLMYRGPNLQVNPVSGTVYQPVSGIVTLTDGSKFYRVAGSGLPTATGTYATGTGLYYNPAAGTFFNPRSGILSKPAQTNVFVPYIW